MNRLPAVDGLDLVSQAALSGAALLFVTRPSVMSRVAHSPLIPMARQLARRAARLRRPLPAPERRTTELARLVATYAPSAQSQRSELTRSAGRRVNGSAALLAFSVLADSAVEHHRGAFANRAMYTPLIAASLTLGASLFGVLDGRARKHVVRDAIYAVAAATGLAGLGFHAYNMLKRPGGLCWQNLFYAAPAAAPAALTLAGVLGRAAERVRDTKPWRAPSVLGLPAGRMLAGIAAAGLAGTVGEAGLLHFRGAYQDPAMFAPVTVPPVAAALLGTAALRPSRTANRLARWWLRLTALLGFAGVGFHAYGVSRNMGGWRNWRQNLLNGPPLPAPPSFIGLALAGLAALSLIEEANDG